MSARKLPKFPPIPRQRDALILTVLFFAGLIDSNKNMTASALKLIKNECDPAALETLVGDITDYMVDAKKRELLQEGVTALAKKISVKEEDAPLLISTIEQGYSNMKSGEASIKAGIPLCPTR